MRRPYMWPSSGFLNLQLPQTPKQLRFCAQTCQPAAQRRSCTPSWLYPKGHKKGIQFWGWPYPDSKADPVVPWYGPSIRAVGSSMGRLRCIILALRFIDRTYLDLQRSEVKSFFPKQGVVCVLKVVLPAPVHQNRVPTI